MSTHQTELHPSDINALRDITAAAADIFIALPRRHAAMAYLRQRGIDPSTLGPEWFLGYAPPGWTRMVDKLRERFDDESLIDAGVARRSSRGTLIDVFRNRLILGLRHGDGSLAGFIGRDLSNDPLAPKYLNTHHHALFDKSVLLYGLYEAGQDLTASQPVIVEGPLDALAIASRSRREQGCLLPVSACGTAFTSNHARAVAELAFAHRSPVAVALDGDTAGRRAALVIGERLRKFGIDVRVTQLAAGSDPAECLMRHDATVDAFRAEQATPLINAQAEYAVAMEGDRMQWPEGRVAALRNIGRHLATFPPNFVARQVPWLAELLGLDQSTVTLELADAVVSRQSMKRPALMSDRGFDASARRDDLRLNERA